MVQYIYRDGFPLNPGATLNKIFTLVPLLEDNRVKSNNFSSFLFVFLVYNDFYKFKYNYC